MLVCLAAGLLLTLLPDILKGHGVGAAFRDDVPIVALVVLALGGGYYIGEGAGIAATERDWEASRERENDRHPDADLTASMNRLSAVLEAARARQAAPVHEEVDER